MMAGIHIQPVKQQCIAAIGALWLIDLFQRRKPDNFKVPGFSEQELHVLQVIFEVSIKWKAYSFYPFGQVPGIGRRRNNFVDAAELQSVRLSIAYADRNSRVYPPAIG